MLTPQTDGEFPHWMLREIFEQPEALARTLAAYVAGGAFAGEAAGQALGWVRQAEEIVIVASGSSRHAGMVAEILMEDRSGLPVDVEYASEYTFRSPRSRKRASVIVVSQSGETADTLAALRHANANGCPTLAITNVAGSTMAREAGVSFPTLAGRERAVPATKSFTTQLLSVSLLSLLAGQARGTLSDVELASALTSLEELPELIAAQLPAWRDAASAIAPELGRASSALFLGRGVHYPIAREGALKLKESAYLHAEGYPSGELKHGPNALTAEGTPLVMLATVDEQDRESVARYRKVLALMKDMREQGAEMLAIANAGDSAVARLANHTVTVEATPEALLPFCEVIPLQLLSYFTAVHRGIDVDQPRNLSKAVLQD